MAKINDKTVRLALAALAHYQEYDGSDAVVEEHFPNLDDLDVLVMTEDNRTNKEVLIEVLEVLKQAVKERKNG